MKFRMILSGRLKVQTLSGGELQRAPDPGGVGSAEGWISPKGMAGLGDMMLGNLGGSPFTNKHKLLWVKPSNILRVELISSHTEISFWRIAWDSQGVSWSLVAAIYIPFISTECPRFLWEYPGCWSKLEVIIQPCCSFRSRDVQGTLCSLVNYPELYSNVYNFTI